LNIDTLRLITFIVTILTLATAANTFADEPPNEEEAELVGSDPDDAQPPTIPEEWQMEGEDWELVWRDEFQGEEVDQTKWSNLSSSLRDQQQGNCGENDQQEWNTFDNITVSNGVLTMNAHRLDEPYSSGPTCDFLYPWTGVVMNSSPGISFSYAYIETRSKLPTTLGMWTAFWTWQAPGADVQKEIDIKEYWSEWTQEEYLNALHGPNMPNIVTGSSWVPWGADNGPGEWNVYGADIRPDGIYFYLNGELVNRAVGKLGENPQMNIITNLAVSRGNLAPPPDVDHAQKHVDYIRVWKRTFPTVSVETPDLPDQIILHQNYPNPFNPVTRIDYQIPATSDVSLEVFDLLGRHLHTLVDGHKQAGHHSAAFDGTNLSSGIYVYRLTVGNTVQTRKLTLLK